MTALGSDFEKTLRRFVLDQLDEGSRLELEGRLVQDPEAFDALGIIEDELTEEYLDGTLKEDERLRYERYCQSSPERRRMPDFFSTLRDRAAAAADEVAPSTWHPASWFRPAPLPPAWLAAAAAALVLSLGANLWLAQRQDRLEAQPRPEVAEPSVAAAVTPQPVLVGQDPAIPGLEAQLEEERQRRVAAEVRAQELERAAATPSLTIPSFVLAAGVLRSGGTLARVSVEPDVEVVRLLLDLPGDDYSLYSAVLSDQDDEEILSQSRLTATVEPERVVVPVLIPAEALPRGDYQVRLSGLTEDGERERLASYTFRVTGD
jgi:hypothetical protein